MVNKFFFVKGGQERIMFDEAKLLEEQGHEVAFFSMKHPENMPNYSYSKYFIDYVDLSDPNKGYSLVEKLKIARDFIYNESAKEKFKQFIDDFKPDIVHCHGISHQISYSIIDVTTALKIPVVQTLHDYQVVCPNYMLLLSGKELCSNYKCIKGKYYNCLCYKCIKNSYNASLLGMAEMYFNRHKNGLINKINKFIVPSKFLYNVVINSGIEKEKVVLINNFVDIKSTEPEYISHKYFIYVGRLSMEKGLRTLLNAFHNIPTAKIIIIGKGPIEETLIQDKVLNQMENVEFVGYKNKEEINEYLKYCEALILPSEWYENAPVSVLEAFAQGKTVIASNIGGMSEMIKSNYNGYLFLPGSVNDLIIKISNFLNDETIHKKMGRNARAVANQLYNKEIHLQKLLNLYKLTINEVKSKNL